VEHEARIGENKGT